MSELYRSGTESGSETSEPATETKSVARAEHEPAPDTTVSQYEDDAAIEAQLDEAGLPTRAEARAGALRPDTDDEDDEDEFSPESDAAIEARLDEAGLPTRAEARAAARELDAADDDDYDEDDFGPESDAVIEARLDEAGLPTRAEARAAAMRPDATDENDDPLAETPSEGAVSYADGDLRTRHETAESDWPTPEEKARLYETYLDWRNEISTGREQGTTAVSDKPDRSPGDTRDFPPTGEQLVEIDDQKASRAERARKEFLSKENLGDAFDATDKWAKTGQDLFSRLPTGQHVEVPTHEPVITMMQHQEVDSGSVAAAGLALGIIGAEFFQWGRRKVEHRRGRHRASD